MARGRGMISLTQLERQTMEASDRFTMQLEELNRRRKLVNKEPLSYDKFLNVDRSRITDRERKIIGAVLNNYEARKRSR